MKISFFTLCFLIGSMLNFALQAQESDAYQKMSSEFLQPPLRAYPKVYHWWLGGHVDTVRLKEEIRSFHEAGVAGFTIFEIGSRDTAMVGAGPEFLGDESLQTIKLAVEEAGKYGMEVGLNSSSSWNAGGKWMTPEHAAKSIYQRKVMVTGGASKKVKLPFPEIPEKDPRGRTRIIAYGKDGKPVYSEEIAVLALPVLPASTSMDTSRIEDVSAYFDPKTELLDWEVPEGEWKIIRFVSSNSGENLVLPSKYSAGPIVDHFDADATAFNFNYIIGRLESAMGDLRETALKSLYMASYEARGFNWTPTLPEEFLAINGYPVHKFLPILFDEVELSDEATAEFKAGFARTLSELMINNFYIKSKEICQAHGLKNNSEAGGPGFPLHNVPAEPLKALGKGLDIPRGEFWINHHNFSEEGLDVLRVVKETSSASHIYDVGIVEMEAFTTFQQWQEGPFEMKPSGDRAFAEGMNRVVVHGSTHNPAGTGNPGIVYHAGTHYNDKRVWWEKIRPFNEYLARVSYVLQEADFKADVMYYYGDSIPTYGGHKRSRFNPGEGYDFELVNTEILLGLEVKKGKVINPRNGAKFSVLALTEEYAINLEVLVKLEQMAQQGAMITGPKPKRIAPARGGMNLPDGRGMLDKLWQPYSKESFKPETGIIYEASVGEILQGLKVSPDFAYKDKGFFSLDYTHYQKDGIDFYFVVNTTGESLSRDLTFRQQGKVPELWDPESGRIVAIPIFEESPEGITLPFSLAAYESVFITFKPGENKRHFSKIAHQGIHPPSLRYTEQGIEFWEEGAFGLEQKEDSRSVVNYTQVKALEGAWEVYFPEGWGAPEKAIFPELKSWTESNIEGIKYFSGTARYEKSFIHEIYPSDYPEARIYLDLGNLSHIAEVWLNDKPLGITWSKPYRFDVTDALKPGLNSLKIEVANTWSNRLTGDALLGEDFTRTHVETTVIKGIPNKRFPWKDAPLIPSGIFGPVTLTTVLPVAAPQELSAARIFSDHMVLQRDQPIPIWGLGTPGEQVSVQLDKAIVEAVVDRNGKWKVDLSAFPAGGPYELSIQSAKKKIQFTDVLIGDVWFASGQSNMQHPISGWEWIPNSAILEADKVLEKAKSADIRVFSVPIFPSPVPLSDLPGGQWERVHANSLAQFSATAWFFAEKLNQELDIPIGIIHSSWGGTSILAWTNQDALDDFKDSLRIPPLPANINWEQQVEASVENHRIRRNAISYPDGALLQRIMSASGKNENWQKAILPDESKDLGFVSWLQKELILEKNQANNELTLHLGFLNRQSHVYWNGSPLGYFQYPAPVTATVHAAWVKEGANTITLRVASPAGSGRVQGDQEAFYLEGNPDNASQSLAGEWKLLEQAEPIPEALPSYVNLPSFLFNGMVAPVIPYGLKGFIWDQGSADASRPLLYEQLFKRLITDWRGFWHNERLPFLFVQNTGTYVTHQFAERSFKRSYLREAQQSALDLPETAMMVAIDLGDPYDVHPKNKLDFGNRLALQALEKVYGKPIVADGPYFGKVEQSGDTLLVQASDPSQQLVLTITDGHTGFEIAGPSGQYFPAQVRLQDNILYIHSPAVDQPRLLRYAWGDYPATSVFNSEGLPMAAFRLGLD